MPSAPFRAVLLLAPLLALSAPARAAFSDPAGDFLTTYTGPHNGDMDVTSIDVHLNAGVFTLAATLAGTVGTTANALYVWGLDRGAGLQRFQLTTPANPVAIGPGVTFDSVLIINPGAGTIVFTDIAGGGVTTALGSSALQISGNAITAELPVADTPSKGRTPEQFGFNLWPRQGLGLNTQVSDFAPDASDLLATVPAPGSASVFGLALAAFLALRRRKPV